MTVPYPPDPSGNNIREARAAEVAVLAYQGQTGMGDIVAVEALLAALMHHCDRSKDDFDAALHWARSLYRDDTA